MSVLGHSAFFTSGGAGLISGLNAHHARCSGVMVTGGLAGVPAALTGLPSGHGAPDAIHCSNAAIVASGSLSSPLGIGLNP
jgi:hypothetical protein